MCCTVKSAQQLIFQKIFQFDYRQCTARAVATWNLFMKNLAVVFTFLKMIYHIAKQLRIVTPIAFVQLQHGGDRIEKTILMLLVYKIICWTGIFHLIFTNVFCVITCCSNNIFIYLVPII